MVGAGASYLGSKKQSDASKAAANLNLDWLQTLNRQQQPFIQSGYGATGRLNTLLGLNPNPSVSRMTPSQAYMPTPGGGVRPVMQVGPSADTTVSPGSMPISGQMTRMKDLLGLRAANGDRQAQAILRSMV